MAESSVSPSTLLTESVAIRAWSVRGTLGTTRAEFRRALEAGQVGLSVSSDALPSSLGLPGSLGAAACLGALGSLPALPKIAQASTGVASEPVWDTRQLRLAWAGLTELGSAVEAVIARYGGERVALLLGTSTGGIQASEEAFLHHHAHGELPRDYSCRGAHAFDAVLPPIARRLGIFGPRYVVSTACSSAGKALASARRLILSGAVDAAVVGGVDTLCRLTVLGFAGLGVLSDRPCRPLADEPSGMNVSEGSAWLLLERGAGAISLLGAGESADAHHMVSPHPEGLGARLAIEAALSEAGLTPNEIDHVNAHGTGTRANDEVERTLLATLFPHASISATKSLHGHLLGASTVTEAVVCAEILSGARPATLQGAPPRDWPPRHVLKNSFAFGGSNVSLVFGPGDASPAREPRALTAFVERVGVWGEGFCDLGAVISGERANVALPPAELLPARQRGRASLLTRLVTEVLGQLGTARELSTLPVVCGSMFGPSRTTLELLDRQLRGESSPLLFPGSVHNAPLGSLSIALGNHEFQTSLAAGPHTVSMTLLEALCWLNLHPEHQRIAVVFADEGPPAPLLDEDFPPLAVGLLLSREGDSLAPQLELHRNWQPAHEAPGTAVDDLPLPPSSAQHLLDNPCGPALRLALALEHRRNGTYDLAAQDPTNPAERTASAYRIRLEFADPE